MRRSLSSARLAMGVIIAHLAAIPAGGVQRIPALLPQMTVPDTRGLRFVADTAVVTAALAILGNAMPNEGGLCFYGSLAVISGQMTVVVRRVSAARGHGRLGAFDWAPKLGHGCSDEPDLVGAGHSHPYSDCRGEQSALRDSRADVDVRSLAGDPRLLFSMIWCFGQARAVILWQDGGRDVVNYLDLSPAPSPPASPGCPDRGAGSHGGT